MVSNFSAVPIETIVRHPVPGADSKSDGSDALKKFAVINFSGRQYKVAVDDTIVADHLQDVDLDSVVTIDDVLLVGTKDETRVGRPYVVGAKVELTVEELAKDKKQYILKYRRRKNSKRLRGFRRQVTILRVADISTDF